MNWFLIALVPPLLWSFSNHLDKFIISKYFKSANAGALMLYTAIAGSLMAPVCLLFDHNLGLPLTDIVILIISGMLYVVSAVPYFYALASSDVSVITPLFQLIPIYTYILGRIFLNEQLTGVQLFASALILTGAVGISLDLTDKKIKLRKKPLLLMALAGLMYALSGFLFKFITVGGSFWVTSFWSYIGFAIMGLVLYFLVPAYKASFHATFAENKATVLAINGFNEAINILGKLANNFASLLAPIALVWVVSGIQPLFVFLEGIVLTVFFPHISKENIDRHVIVQKLVFILVIMAGAFLLSRT